MQPGGNRLWDFLWKILSTSSEREKPDDADIRFYDDRSAAKKSGHLLLPKDHQSVQGGTIHEQNIYGQPG